MARKLFKQHRDIMTKRDKNDGSLLRLYLSLEKAGIYFRLPIFLFFLSALFFCVDSATSSALDESLNSPDIKESAKELTLPQVAEKIQDLEKRIKNALRAEINPAARQLGLTLADLNERTEKLRSIQSAHERFLTALKKKSLLEEEEALFRKKLLGEQRQGIAQMPPYNLSFYDAIMDELAEAQQQKDTFDLAVKLSKRTLEDYTLRLEKARKEWRGLKELLDAGSKEDSSLQLNWNLETAQLEIELLEILIGLEKANCDNLLKQVKISELRTDLSRLNINWVRDHLYFDETDLESKIKTLAQTRTALEKRVRKLIQGQEETRETWLRAEKQATITADGKPDPARQAFLKEREAWRETYQAALEQTEETLRLSAHQEQIWRLRYGLVKGGVTHKDLVNRKDEIEDHIRNLNRLINVQQSHHSNLQSQLVSLQKKSTETDLDPSITPHLENRIRALQRLAEKQFDYTSVLLVTKQMDHRVLDEIDSMLNQVNLKQQLANIKDQFQEIWDFEVWVVDNNSVTVRELLVAFLILVIGILGAKYLLRTITRRLFQVARLKETTASAMQKILTYFAYLLVLLFALRIVNIPLTAFAFLGGAIAIGVGFGAQNLINNFISGFIMMAERPINVGDLIEVEGILGKVEDIGARCTRVRTGGNIHILVPNSSFLEKNITNWTLSDRTIRTGVTVGIVYGAPVREAEKLLLKALNDNNRINKSPEPFVIFSDFGDNALVFELYFWISIHRVMEKRLIESMVRFRIDELFREAGIVIAFPQRDVHLDTQRPLEFRLVDDTKG